MGQIIAAQGYYGGDVTEYIQSLAPGTKGQLLIENIGRENCGLWDSWIGEWTVGNPYEGLIRIDDVSCEGTIISGADNGIIDFTVIGAEQEGIGLFPVLTARAIHFIAAGIITVGLIASITGLLFVLKVDDPEAIVTDIKWIALGVAGAVAIVALSKAYEASKG